jgi:predicted DNA-binding transcriptional regulator AlpA
MRTDMLDTGYLRLRQIIGDPRSTPAIPALIPVSKSTWWEGVRAGRYPQPVRSLGPRITVWRAQDIRALIESTSRYPSRGQAGALDSPQQ